MTEDNMPQTKKESPGGGFNFFFLDVKKKTQGTDVAFISKMAATIWEHMKPDERWVYEQQARKKKHNLYQMDFKNTFTEKILPMD
jgi:hypothetical protein